ncbi:MAG: hypothetical protein CVU05_08185 [Bacteroidetes bacterium HGW-Bacteroidetes-21]|nr:MAG: hypothetical protein CVU05_08185 [Bacteroidetes bacterium HGW-Bacteroidetes-21]
MKKLIIILFVFFCQYGQAQTYNFRHYTVEDGLLHEFINDMIQDSRGNVWIATGAGLSDFNGFEFTNYTTKNGLNNTRVLCLAEDSSHNVWSGTSKGINVFDGNVFYSLKGNGLAGSVLAMEQTGKTGMLVLSDSGLYNVRFLLPGFEVKRIPFLPVEKERMNIFQQRDLSHFIVKTKDYGFLFGFGEHLYAYNHQKITKIVMPGTLSVFSACELNNHDVLIGTNQGLFLLKNMVLTPVLQNRLSQASVFKIRAQNNKIWLIARWNNEAESFLVSVKLANKDYYRKIGKKNGLINPPTSLFIDHENNVWCSSYGGVSVLRGESFINFSQNSGLKAIKIWGVAEDSLHKIWVGSIGEGLSIISNDTLVRNFSESDGLPDMFIGKIFQVDKTHMLLGTAKHGLCMAEFGVSNNSYKFSQIKCDLNQRETRVDDIVRDKNGDIWVATSSGLFYGAENGNYIHYSLFAGDTGQVFTQKLLQAKNGDLWIVTKNEGLYKMTDGKFVRIFPEFFKNAVLSSITQDCSGRIWVGSQTHGIVDVSEESPHWINEKDGLASNLVYILQADNHCNLWVGTNIGLDKIVLHAYHKRHLLDIRHYDSNNGLGSLEMNLNGSLIDQDDNVWFATNHGLLKYNYIEDLINNVPPILSLTNVRLFSKDVDWSAYSDSLNPWNHLPRNPTLAYDENHVTFQFVGISYKNPKKIQYSWKLEGFDEKWNPESSSRFAIYSNLPPGKFTFRLRSSNNEGLWTPEETVFAFEISPPFWQEWWFRILALFVIIAVLYLIYRWRIVSMKRTQSELEFQVRERTAEILAQKDKIEEIHHVVEQSIEYAKNIQNSILPTFKVLEESFSDYFVMYVPRDKVSGDFYWWTKMKLDNIYVLTVADCTGHGVPGAFMSMLGISMLNEIVNKEYFWHPPVILRKMRKDIINSLKQSGEIGEMKDGMDMAIVSINMDTMELQFAGANNSLLLITEDAQRFDDMPRIRKMTLGNKTLYEFLPDKMPISVFDRMNKFSVHEINVVKGDQFYIFSDGYADQFGGSKGKKFMMKKFKTLLMENCDKPMAEQKQALVDALNQWQGNLDQVDDITVMGVRL